MKLMLCGLLLAWQAIGDTPGAFSAECDMLAVASADDLKPVHLTGSCFLQDGDHAAGYNNLFRIYFTSKHLPQGVGLERFADLVRSESHDGKMTVSSGLWGRIVLWPDELSIQYLFYKYAFETRPQYITVRRLGRNTLEITIDEPAGPFFGGSWPIDNYDAFKLLGGAH